MFVGQQSRITTSKSISAGIQWSVSCLVFCWNKYPVGLHFTKFHCAIPLFYQADHYITDIITYFRIVVCKFILILQNNSIGGHLPLPLGLPRVMSFECVLSGDQTSDPFGKYAQRICCCSSSTFYWALASHVPAVSSSHNKQLNHSNSISA